MPFVCNRRIRGFTLIELMVALGIATILVFLAVPSMSAFIKNQRLSSQANDLVADLNFARSEAIKRARPVRICKINTSDPLNCDTTGTNWSNGRIIFLDLNNNMAVDSGAGEEILRTRQELTPAGKNTLYGESGTAAEDGITFIASGLTTLASDPTATEVELKLCDDRDPPLSGGAGAVKYGRAIVIHPTGRVRVTEPAKDKANGALSCT